jgi:rhamnogalacturonan endolyase
MTTRSTQSRPYLDRAQMRISLARGPARFDALRGVLLLALASSASIGCEGKPEQDRDSTVHVPVEQDAAPSMGGEASLSLDGGRPSVQRVDAGVPTDDRRDGAAADAALGLNPVAAGDGPAKLPPGPAKASACGVDPSPARGRNQMEHLCRGLVAMRSAGGNFLSWRLLGYEPPEIAFNVYRDGTKLNVQPIDKVTHYLDAQGPAGAEYTVRALMAGVEQGDSEAASPWPQNYLTVPLSVPQGYTPGDTSVGDLDGDGQYELVVKWENTPRDNSQDGTTGTTKLDAYELDGTRLWRVELGKNIREGAHYTQFIVYDLDGDGMAEVACKTAPGTIDGRGMPVKLGNDDPNADYRNASGYVLSGPEYLTIFSGKTGANLATVPFEVARGRVADWGDDYGNRVDRFLATIAFLDASGRPSLVMGRGYYARTTLTAWNYRDGKLTRIWTADSTRNTAPAGQGAHSISVADVDADGRQEIIFGAATIDDNGTPMCSSAQGHGDALHVSDFVPSRPGLEVFMPHESTSAAAYTLRDAKTCEILVKGPNNNGQEGPGRGVAADIDPRNPGAELWVNNAGPFSATSGQPAGDKPSSCNFLVWWDGDLSRELLDGNRVSNHLKPSQGFTAEGCSAINGSKSTPNLSADLFGDFREEVVFHCGDSLRIYSTDQPTHTRIYTLMHDPQYRAAVAFQNVAYNQPPHPSFHIGEGMAPPPRPDIHVR